MANDLQYGTIAGNSDVRIPVQGSVRTSQKLRGNVGIGTKTIRELAFKPLSEFPETGSPLTLYIDTTGGNAYYWESGMYRSVSGAKIIAYTTEEWETIPPMLSKKDTVYIYTDYETRGDVCIPSMKIGDGKAYIQDLPFIDSGNGVTEAERQFWNNKVSADISLIDPETLILHTD